MPRKQMLISLSYPARFYLRGTTTAAPRPNAKRRLSMACHLDHLVVTAPSLQTGAAFVQNLLGVPLGTGGEHPRMGTHNLLVRLGEAAYLEVIAANPAAAAPDRPRWFDLDRVDGDSPPRLATWVARSTHILASTKASTEPLGSVERMSRGEFDWLITIPPDGSLSLGGTGPAIIEWRSPRHPATALPELGLGLMRLDLIHPQPERVSRLLHALDFRGPVSVQPADAGALPRLSAHISTPTGICRLESRVME